MIIDYIVGELYRSCIINCGSDGERAVAIVLNRAVICREFGNTERITNIPGVAKPYEKVGCSDNIGRIFLAAQQGCRRRTHRRIINSINNKGHGIAEY